MSLVGYWPLDENSGDALDYSGNNNDGTVNGATQGVAGILGTSGYDFDGTDDYISVSDDSSLSFADKNAFSTSFWVKSTSTSFDEPIISKWDATLEYIVKFNGQGDNEIALFVGGNGELQQVTTNWNDGNWHHYAITWVEGGDAVIYKDATEITRTGASSTASDGTDPLEIGARTPADNYANVTLAGIRIYDRALTQSEVQYLYDVSNEAYFESAKKS